MLAIAGVGMASVAADRARGSDRETVMQKVCAQGARKRGK
jgi:hypothetical protein